MELKPFFKLKSMKLWHAARFWVIAKPVSDAHVTEGGLAPITVARLLTAVAKLATKLVGWPSWLVNSSMIGGLLFFISSELIFGRG